MIADRLAYLDKVKVERLHEFTKLDLRIAMPQPSRHRKSDLKIHIIKYIKLYKICNTAIKSNTTSLQLVNSLFLKVKWSNLTQLIFGVVKFD